LEAALDDDTQKFIAQSLTDVDLFASYGLTQKAIGLLEAILRRAPRHTPTLEKLLDFVLGAGDDRRTAELAAKLEKISSERGDARGAERFGELRRRFQRAAGLSDEELAGPSVPPPVAEAEELLPEITPESSVSEFAAAEESGEIEASEPAPIATAATEKVRELDLSDEWASMLEETQPAQASHPTSSHEGLPEFEVPAEAPAEIAAEASAPAESALEEFSITEEPAPAPEAEVSQHAGFELPEETPAPESAQEIDEEIVPASEAAADVTTPEPAVPHQAAAPPEEIPYALDGASVPSGIDEAPAYEAASQPSEIETQPAAKVPGSQAPVEEPEFELDQDYELILDPESLVPAHDQKPPEHPVVPLEPEPEPVAQNTAPTNGFASDQFLSDLANEIDQLGIGELSPGFSGSTPAAEAAASYRNTPRAEQAPISPADMGPLKEVFDEFRAELGEMGSDADEDLETHYNLGIAFREMGLLEEAISEFQKVAKAAERGRPFRYSMQCYTLLGLAFMDRGQPSIAAMWYERALHLPDIEPESELALRYDLGMAQESAGESEAALKSFSQVYAVNIDYRDVGDRIAALQRPAR
jgi:tetratricopeptide (TPR) repeat protein